MDITDSSSDMDCNENKEDKPKVKYPVVALERIISKKDEEETSQSSVCSDDSTHLELSQEVRN